MLEPQLTPTLAYDPLTLALTRPSLMAELQAQVAHAHRTGNGFCICLLDIDRMKTINDAHGLDAGDQVLMAIADRLRAVVAEVAWQRSDHALARYDGNVFLVLSRPCGLHQGETLAEALRFAVAAAAVGEIAVTASVGVAQHRIGEPVDALLARTERVLHLAKQFGRDRVEVASTPPSRPVRAKVVGLFD